MKIVSLRVMRGPNYWSVSRHRLIVMKLDLGQYEQKPTNMLPGFADRLLKLMPSLYEHHCSEGAPGGFLLRVKEGTWLGHVVEHIALEMQTLAGMDVGFGRTRSATEPGHYFVVFAYMEEQAGLFAAEAAVDLVLALAQGAEYDLEYSLQTLREIRERERLGPSTDAIVAEAQRRGIPWLRMNETSLVQLGYGVNQQRIRATISGRTSSIAVDLASDKEETKIMLRMGGIPVADGTSVATVRELERAVRKLGYPLVIKPLDGNHGRGASINISSWEEAVAGLEEALVISSRAIVERFIEGQDHRLLVINHQFVAASLRTPAAVTGDGVHTIQELINLTNADPRRGYGHEKVLTCISVDDHTLGILQEKSLTLDSVLPQGQFLALKSTANLSTGGTATDVTDQVHPLNVLMAERISRIIGLDICGIDVMTTNISQPLADTHGAVLEVNAAPGFRMHTAPTVGQPRNVAAPVIDMLFPQGAKATIPIIAVTGTNGKTTTTRLIAHMVKNVGYRVGFTTTDGVYIHNQLVEKGDCTGPASAQLVLRDPSVEFAVLECARGGIVRAGLGFQQSDIGIVTNVAEDHLGLNDIHTIEDMARVKAVVIESVRRDGYAILNADDDLVYDMRHDAICNVALFSLDENNPRILEHCANGGLAAVVSNGSVVICKGAWKMRVGRIVNFPITFDGKASFMVQNILPAALAGFISNFRLEDIRAAIETFSPGSAMTPGRLNYYNFERFGVLIDYAHNTAGMIALGQFVDKLEASVKVGIVAGVGDRRDEDIINLGAVAARYFDELIVREDSDLRGREPGEVIDLLQVGIAREKPLARVTPVHGELEALQYAIENAKEGCLITICTEQVGEVIEQVTKLREQYSQNSGNRQGLTNIAKYSS